MCHDHPMSQSKATSPSPAELTLRGILLGGVITLLFTAANVYLGLKVGLTFATSIPAAVISMALLRGFKDSTILENNIVQTVASAAGTLAAEVATTTGWLLWPAACAVVVAALTFLLGGNFAVELAVFAMLWSVFGLLALRWRTDAIDVTIATCLLSLLILPVFAATMPIRLGEVAWSSPRSRH
eukprot:gene34306-46019_t